MIHALRNQLEIVDLDPYGHRTPVDPGECRQCGVAMIRQEAWVYCEYCGAYENCEMGLI